jgi:hypothetical protein
MNKVQRFLAVSGVTIGAGMGYVMPAHAADAALSVDTTGRFDARSGHLVVSGSYTCSPEPPVMFGGVLVDARQSVGRIATVTGFGTGQPFPECTGEPVAWTADIAPTSGLFKGGRATVDVSLFAQRTDGSFDSASVSTVIRLRP